jgi:hypothetical protein
MVLTRKGFVIIYTEKIQGNPLLGVKSKKGINKALWGCRRFGCFRR